MGGGPLTPRRQRAGGARLCAAAKGGGGPPLRSGKGRGQNPPARECKPVLSGLNLHFFWQNLTFAGQSLQFWQSLYLVVPKPALFLEILCFCAQTCTFPGNPMFLCQNLYLCAQRLKNLCFWGQNLQVFANFPKMWSSAKMQKNGKKVCFSPQNEPRRTEANRGEPRREPRRTEANRGEPRRTRFLPNFENFEKKMCV